MLNKGCYRISIAFSVFMWKSENDSNTLRVDACFFFVESGGYVWTVPKSLNPCCVWIQKIIVLKTSLIKAKKEKNLMHFNQLYNNDSTCNNNQ